MITVKFPTAAGRLAQYSLEEFAGLLFQHNPVMTVNDVRAVIAKVLPDPPMPRNELASVKVGEGLGGPYITVPGEGDKVYEFGAPWLGRLLSTTSDHFFAKVMLATAFQRNVNMLTRKGDDVTEYCSSGEIHRSKMSKDVSDGPYIFAWHDESKQVAVGDTKCTFYFTAGQIMSMIRNTDFGETILYTLLGEYGHKPTSVGKLTVKIDAIDVHRMVKKAILDEMERIVSNLKDEGA